MSTLPDFSAVTDDDVLAALKLAVPENPSGASIIDVVYAWNVQPIQDALVRLEGAGRIKQTSPGNYLPVEN